MLTVVAAGGGGGASYPGVTGDNLTPGGLVVAGGLEATATPTATQDAILVHVTDDSAHNALGVEWSDGITSQVTAEIEDGAIQLCRQDGTRLVQLMASAFNPGLFFHNQDGSNAAGYAEQNASLPGYLSANQVIAGFGGVASGIGVGMFGLDPPAAPRTLPQATIDAITDANAKAAVQACANALADMGALTLT